MKILILSSSSPYKASGIVGVDLMKSLLSTGNHEVKLLVKPWGQYPDNIIPFESRLGSIIAKGKRFLKRKNLNHSYKKTDSKYYFQEYDLTKTFYSTDHVLKRIDFMPDAIIVLFMTSFLSFKNLQELGQRTKAPVFVYMMDMALITGGCHYAWSCNGYLYECGQCPAFFTNIENDQSRKNWEFKNKYISKTNIKAIAASEHQYQQSLKSSLLLKKDKLKILLSVDPNLFKPADQTQARNSLNLPVHKRIIFFGATNIMSKRKGFTELLETLKRLSEVYKNPQEIHLAIAGGGDTGLNGNLPFNYTLLGHLNHAELATAFQAADLFLCPSIEDSGPMMINQSIMSGTPVAAFEMGVALDLVMTGETGYKAKIKDTVDLANGVQQILELNKSESIMIRKKCRNLGLRLCTPESQANRLFDLLRDN